MTTNWLGSAVLASVKGMVRAAVIKPITALAAATVMVAFHATTKLKPASAITVLKNIANIFYSPPREWAAFVSNYMERMTGERLDLSDIIEQGIPAGGGKFIEALGHKFLHPMLNLIQPKREKITPEDGVRGAERFLGVNLQFQLSAWLLHLIGDTVSFGALKSLKDLPNAISWSFGVGWLSWLVMGTPFRKGIADPLEKKYNMVYLPEILAPAQTVDAFIKGFIKVDQFNEMMAMHGFDYPTRLNLVRLKERQYDDTDLKIAYRLDLASKNDIALILRYRGYTERQTKVLSELIVKSRVLSLWDNLITEAGDSYIRGLLPLSRLEQYLKECYYKPDEIKLFISVQNLKKAQRAALTQSEILGLYKAGLMPETETRSRLQDMGFDKWDLYLLMKKSEPAKKKSKTS